MPFRPAGVLGQRGAGHQQSVIAHPEDLVADRQQTTDHDDEQPPPPVGRRDEHHHQSQSADQRQLGAHQHAEPGHERQRAVEPPRGAPSRCRSTRPAAGSLRPAHHHPPQQPQVGEHQTVLQSGGGKVPRRGHGDVDQGAGRQQDRGPPLQPRRIQPGGAEHDHHHAGNAEHQRQRQRHVLQPRRTGHPAAQPHQVRPHGGGVGLHPLAGVEHRTVAGQHVPRGAQDDQTVVGDPAALPGAHTEQHRRHGHAHPQAGPRPDVVREGGPALAPPRRAVLSVS